MIILDMPWCYLYELCYIYITCHKMMDASQVYSNSPRNCMLVLRWADWWVDGVWHYMRCELQIVQIVMIGNDKVIPEFNITFHYKHLQILLLVWDVYFWVLYCTFFSHVEKFAANLYWTRWSSESKWSDLTFGDDLGWLLPVSKICSGCILLWCR